MADPVVMQCAADSAKMNSLENIEKKFLPHHQFAKVLNKFFVGA